MSNLTALEEHLPDVLAGWPATNPGIDIALEEQLSHEIAPAVGQAHADIGVLVDLAGAEGLETYPFRIDRLVVVVPRSHVLAGRRNVAFVDVLDEEFVGLAAGSALAEHLAWQSARLGRPLKPRIRLRGLDAVCRWWSVVWGSLSCRKRPLGAVGEPWHSARCGSQIYGLRAN
jgi:DNA-binding transcriptional LysR family regulator